MCPTNTLLDVVVKVVTMISVVVKVTALVPVIVRVWHWIQKHIGKHGT